MKKNQFVMIVDGDQAWAQSVADLFEAYGYHVEVVADPCQAADRVRERGVDVAFIGANTPAAPGFGGDNARVVRMTGEPLHFERMLELVESAA
jgi:DNA-binding response OmpR family regulator